MGSFDEEQYHRDHHISHKRWLSKGKNYKRKALKAAKELEYGSNVLQMLTEADTDGQVERIMIAAREGKI